MTVMKASRVFCALLGMLAGCTAAKTVDYATPDYRTWKRTTDVVLDYPIPGHQDRFRIPRMNAVGFRAAPAMEGGKLHWNFPEGTVIVKEIYETPKPAPGEEPIQLTIMVKAPKDPRAQGGWLWITRDLPNGKESVFMGNFCITCHANANEGHPYGDGNPREEFRDYVYFVPGEGSPKSGAATPP
ncbi:MAG: cytochrome P460 family protein [Spirochaetia bacterium]